MKVEFKVKPLLAAVSAASAVANGRVKSILGCVKLSCGQSASVAASDSEISIVLPVADAVITEPGEVMFAADKLASILREVTSESVSIETSDGRATIKADRANFKIPTSDAADFPPSPEFGKAEYSVSGGDMRMIIERSVFFDKQATRYAMNCVEFEFSDKLTACTTDSKCLGLTSAVLKTKGDNQQKPLVTPKTLKLLGSILGESDVEIEANENTIKFRSNGAIISSQLGSGKFPNWRRVVPEKTEHSIQIVPAIWQSAIRQASITTSEESRNVRFIFANGTLTLVGTGADVGESSIEVPIEFDGSPTEILLDPLMILAALGLIKGSSAQIGFNDGESPVLITSDCGLRFVQMPCSRS